MNSSRPPEQRCAIAIAACILIVIAVGAVSTSESLPLPGSDVPANPMAGAAVLREIHRYLAAGTAALTMVFCAWLLLRERAIRRRGAAGLALVTVLAESWPGSGAGHFMVHAVLAPLLFSSVVAIAILSSPDFGQVRPGGGNAGLVRSIPPIILLQIVLGAAFRHNSTNVLWHILNAAVVISLVLIATVLLLRPPAVPPALRIATLTLAVAAGAQVLLGFAVYIALLMSAENSAAIAALSAAHVVTGTLTLAAGVALAMRVRR